MPNSSSDLIRLYGTDEPIEPLRTLKAGPLSAEFEAGNLRHVGYYGHEMIRAVSFIVRDENWGTYAPKISHLKFLEQSDTFHLTYEATVAGKRGEFGYSAEIVGESNGSLRFSATGNAESDFLTNRTGFVVLHPIEGVAGEACTVEHVNGQIEQTRFPFLIDPVQPMKELRAITNQFGPGLKVTCRMEGDIFEMEDQRNWTDASYKTYVRPLALPWPYVISKGETVSQSVTLTVHGSLSAVASGDRRLSLSVGEAVTGCSAPMLGLALHPKNLSLTEQKLDALREVGPSHLLCHCDPRFGHNQSDLKRMAAVGQAIGSEVWLEFVIPTVDHFEQDIQELGHVLTQLDHPFSTIMVSPAADLKCTLPGSPWPPCPPLDACYRAARIAFPSASLGGGMFSFFTELNRKRPPATLLDLVTFTTIAIFHAGDDRSAMEGLESLPYLAKTVEAFIHGKPYHVGPSAIGARMNPYGEAPMTNPRNIRQAMNGMDPRQRGLFAAAWSIGFFARFTAGRASAITIGEAVGELGIVYVRGAYPQPWFDENDGVYPAYHALKGLASLRGRPLLNAVISEPRNIQAVATLVDDGVAEIWVANLTDQAQKVELTPKLPGTVSILSASDFEHAARDLFTMESLRREFAGDELALPPYAIARLSSPQ
ncbi:MAG TPA: hypothetical protein VE154_05025 [Chthoniobacterales bacterium]|nr:hypothetical protein [Chthoniobacterales bacterium]